MGVTINNVSTIEPPPKLHCTIGLQHKKTYLRGFDKVRLKPVSSATETSLFNGIVSSKFRYNTFKKQLKKLLMAGLHICLQNPEDGFSRIVGQFN